MSLSPSAAAHASREQQSPCAGPECSREIFISSVTQSLVLLVCPMMSCVVFHYSSGSSLGSGISLKYQVFLNFFILEYFQSLSLF